MLDADAVRCCPATDDLYRELHVLGRSIKRNQRVPVDGVVDDGAESRPLGLGIHGRAP